MSNRQDGRLSSVAQALRVLDLLREDEPLGVTEVAQRVGVAPSTAHRLLNTLMDARYVRQSPSDRKYRVGPMLLGTQESAAMDHCVETALPHMERLRDRSGETIQIAHRQRHHIKFIAALESQHVMRVTNRAGQLLPAHATAAGKLLLSQLPDDEVRSVLAPNWQLPTVHTATTPDEFLAELRTTRRLGYGRNYSEAEVGVTAFAVALHRPSGDVQCALTLTCPSARMEAHETQTSTSREADFVRMLQSTARDIEGELTF